MTWTCVGVARCASTSCASSKPRSPWPGKRAALQLGAAGAPRNAARRQSVVANANLIEQGKLLVAKWQAGSYDEAAIKAKVEGLIANTPVVVFSWTGCPYCKRAKALLDSLGARYTAVELDTLGEGSAYRAELAKITGRTSVPAVFITSQFVGGCNDGGLGGVVTLSNDGCLLPLLQAAGAL